MATPTDTHSAPRSLLIDRVGHSVLQRLLAGVNGPDLRSAALTCKAFYAVITAPRFYAVRRRYGFFSVPRTIVVLRPSSSKGSSARQNLTPDPDTLMIPYLPSLVLTFLTFV